MQLFDALAGFGLAMVLRNMVHFVVLGGLSRHSSKACFSQTECALLICRALKPPFWMCVMQMDPASELCLARSPRSLSAPSSSQTDEYCVGRQNSALKNWIAANDCGLKL